MTTVGSRRRGLNGMRCPTCGRREVFTGRCEACGEGELVAQQQIVSTAPPSIMAPARAALPPERVEELAPAPRVYPVHRAPSVPSRSGLSGFGLSEVRGRVLIVRPGPNEPMDFDPWRWVAIPVFGLLLILTPAAISILVWQRVGLFPAVTVALFSIHLLRFTFSNRLLQSWQITAALNGRHVVESMPISVVRLRLEDEGEVQLRLKGHASGGSVIEGDRIIASGVWRNGVLHVDRILCERTHARITLHQPRAFCLALAGGGALLIVALWLGFDGIPWVVDQWRIVRTSIQDLIPNPELLQP